MKQILVHAGFHKTGTTSVQKMLVHNRKTLRRKLQIFTRRNMVGPCEAARAYSIRRTEADLMAFCSELAASFAKIDPTDPRAVLISSEDLSGHMPGRFGLTLYDAAPALMRALCDTAQQAFDAPVSLSFFFSTRAPEAWLRSCHAQHLRAIRMTDDLDSYATQYAASADLDAIVSAVRTAVAPHRVHSAPLEDLTDDPLGPLGILFDTLDIPPRLRQQLDILPPANLSPPDALLADYLATNRSDLDDATVAQTKIAARRAWLNADKTP